MPGELYGRYWRATVGRPVGVGTTDLTELIDLAGLRTGFSIERAHTKNLNTGIISIYNLSEATRAKITGKGLSAVLEAGYVGNSSIIFSGDIERVTHKKQGSSWETRLETDDGSRARAQSRVSIALAAGAKLVDAIRPVAEKMGVSVERALQDLQSGKVDFSRAMRDFVNGASLSGQAHAIFDQLATSLGFEYSIQNGELVVTTEGQPASSEAIVLSPSTGLIGSVEHLEDGKLKAKAKIIPGLEPPRSVHLKSRTFKGSARIDRAKWSGDSGGADWHVEMEVLPL